MTKDYLGSILVLDDHVSLARDLASMLEQALPCAAEATDHPRRATVDQLDSPYDLIITDLSMPGRDGLAVLAEIKTLHPDCEVMIVTEYGTLSTAVEAMRLGATDYIEREAGTDNWRDPLIERVRQSLSTRPSRRVPGHARENLIRFFLERTSLQPKDRFPSDGLFGEGLALEYATKLLLESSGFRVNQHRWRTVSEEHDLVCLKPSRHEFWDKQKPVVLVECKDYRATRLGAKERSRFEEKIRNRKGQCTVGIFISSSGFTKPFLMSSSAGTIPGAGLPLVVPVDGEGIVAWAKSFDRRGWLTDRAFIASIS